MFLPLALSVTHASMGALLATGALVVVAALLMTALAVALGCVVADLSDDHRSALGPGTVYLFLLLGGCLNVAFQMQGWAAARVLLLYALAALAFWRTGMVQVGACLDPEVRATKVLRLSDAAILLLLFAVAPLAIARGFARAEVPAHGVAEARIGAALVMGLIALVILMRRRSPRPSGRVGVTAKLLETGQAIVVGAAFGGVVRATCTGFFGGPAFAPARFPDLAVAALVGALALADELVFRGVVQGAIEADLSPRVSARARRWLAMPVALAVAWLATPLSAAQPWWSPLLIGMGPALARAAGGGVVGACAARLMSLIPS
jgi:hypothetical protein